MTEDFPVENFSLHSSFCTFSPFHIHLRRVSEQGHKHGFVLCVAADTTAAHSSYVTVQKESVYGVCVQETLPQVNKVYTDLFIHLPQCQADDPVVSDRNTPVVFAKPSQDIHTSCNILPTFYLSIQIQDSKIQSVYCCTVWKQVSLFNKITIVIIIGSNRRIE